MFIGIILCIIYAFTFKKCLIVTQANESKHSTSNNALNKTFKHCPNCGKKSPASADVCYKCGKQLK
jgi:ribosomal protein L40E